MYNPPVNLFVREYRSRQVAVVGAVERPGLYNLASEADTILDMIAQAGGMKEGAAPRIQFIPAEPVASGQAKELASALPVQLASKDSVPFILKKSEPEAQRLTILNVAGRGQPLSYEECISIAKAKLIRVPGETLFALALRFLWKLKISTIPPDIVPYLTSDTVMDTLRLAEFLGPEYKDVVRYSCSEAFADCFKWGDRSAEKKETAAPA